MGKGRRPIAPEVHKANGTYVKHPERENKQAPVADGNAPEMPNYFNEDEASKWAELVTDLRTECVLSSTSRELMIAYCTAFGGWIAARRKVQELGQCLGEGDKAKRNPHSVELHKYRDQMNRLLPEFGLTPSSRGKLVSMNVDGKDSPFHELLDRMGSLN